MRYELLIRPLAEGGRFEPEVVRAALQAAQLGDGESLPVERDLGSGKLRVEGFRREPEAFGAPAPDGAADAWQGLNVSFAMGLQAAEGDRAVGLAFELAQALGAQVFDPQIGDLVKPSDHDRILATWRRAWAFQADVVGASGLGSGDPGLPEPERGFLGGRTGLALTIIFFLLLLVYLVRACSASDDEPQPAVPHPPLQSGSTE